MSKAKIVSNPEILGGKPVIYGTRISVELLMNFLGAGMSVDEILQEYPGLKKEEIYLAINYATSLVAKVKPEKENEIKLSANRRSFSASKNISITLHETAVR